MRRRGGSASWLRAALQAPRRNWPDIFVLSAWFQRLYSFQYMKNPFQSSRTLWKFDVRMLWARASDQRSRIWTFSQAPRACYISGSLQKHVLAVSLGLARVCLMKCVSLFVVIGVKKKKRHKSHKFAKIMQFTRFCCNFDLVAKYAFSQAPNCTKFSLSGSASDSRTSLEGPSARSRDLIDFWSFILFYIEWRTL